MRWGLYLAWVIALAGTLGSFYYSEIALIAPCQLCWYQRTMLLPLVLQLGVAAYRSDVRFAPYGYLLCFVGGIVALLQGLQPIFGAHLCGSSGCDNSPLLFGLVPLPWASALAFAVIALLLFSEKKRL